MSQEADRVSGKVFDRRLIARLLTYTRPYRGLFVLAMCLTVLMAVVSPLRPILIQHTLDVPVALGDGGGLLSMILLLSGLTLLDGCLVYANTYLTSWLGQHVIHDIRIRVYTHVMRLRLRFFDKTPVGMLQTRTISDVETLNDVFTTGIVTILGEMLQLVTILGAMMYVSWDMTLVSLTTIPFLILAAIVFNQKVKVSFQAVRKAVAEMNAFLQEHITGMQIVHIFNREDTESARFEQINGQHLKANLNSVLYYSIFFPVVEIISAIAMGVLVWYGAGQVIVHRLAFGELVAFIMFIQMFFRPIRNLADQFNVLQMGMVSAERIFKILDTDETVPDTGHITSYTHQTGGAAIAFEGVDFAYQEPDWVLRDITFAVAPGQKLALVGSTGSGKSTIVNLLNRFYDIQTGTIRIDGHLIQDYTLEVLRSRIGVVLQDVFLFSGSIYDNITLQNPGISREIVEKAARRVGAHEFIMRLPGGYDYAVRERGATLSLGQRQLIAFARVLVYDPDILVLDEATANIDTESEEIIQRAIDTVMAGRTSIIIAHRLSTIQKADHILVMQQGRIIESGAHTTLLAQEGMYFQLYQKQFV